MATMSMNRCMRLLITMISMIGMDCIIICVAITMTMTMTINIEIAFAITIAITIAMARTIIRSRSSIELSSRSVIGSCSRIRSSIGSRISFRNRIRVSSIHSISRSSILIMHTTSITHYAYYVHHFD